MLTEDRTDQLFEHLGTSAAAEVRTPPVESLAAAWRRRQRRRVAVAASAAVLVAAAGAALLPRAATERSISSATTPSAPTARPLDPRLTWVPSDDEILRACLGPLTPDDRVVPLTEVYDSQIIPWDPRTASSPTWSVTVRFDHAGKRGHAICKVVTADPDLGGVTPHELYAEGRSFTPDDSTLHTSTP